MNPWGFASLSCCRTTKLRLDLLYAMMMAGSLWCPWTFFQSSNEIPRSKQLRHVSSQHPGASAMLNISVKTSSTSLVSFLAISGNFWQFLASWIWFRILYVPKLGAFVRTLTDQRPWKSPRSSQAPLASNVDRVAWRIQIFKTRACFVWGVWMIYFDIYIYDIRILIFGKGLLGFSETEVSIFMLWRLF